MKNAFKIGLSVWFGALLLQGCNVYSEDLLLTSETSSLDDDLSDGKWWHTTVPCPRDDLGASLQCGPTKEGCESEGMPKPGDRMPSDAAAGDVDQEATNTLRADER